MVLRLVSRRRSSRPGICGGERRRPAAEGGVRRRGFGAGGVSGVRNERWSENIGG